MARVFHDCRLWLHGFLIDNPTVRYVVFESPLLPMFVRGKTNKNTTRQLMGLPAIVEEYLHARGGYDVREAEVKEVRIHFLGSNKHKREAAKALTMQKCKALGWDPWDDNAADALALWDYQASLLYPLRRH